MEEAPRTLKFDANFPLVIARGNAFCNRVTERSYLAKNIMQRKHTLLLAPRRYGKSSLIAKVLEEQELTGYTIDLFPITDAQSVFNAIFNGVSTLLTEILPKHKNLLQKLYKIFGNFNPSVELSLAGQKIKFQADSNSSIPENIMNLLKGLDQIAVDWNVAITREQIFSALLTKLSQQHCFKNSLQLCIDKAHQLNQTAKRTKFGLEICFANGTEYLIPTSTIGSEFHFIKTKQVCLDANNLGHNTTINY